MTTSVLCRRSASLIFALAWLSRNAVSADQFGDFTFTDDGASITISDYPDTATGEVVIPETINGKPVTIIGERAFQDCKWLTRVTIPDSVTTIENGAFQRCSFIGSVAIGNSVTSIGGLAFGECIRLSAVRIPDSVTAIAFAAFSDCYWLVDVDLGKGVTMIGTSAFLRAALDHIIIPASVENVGQSAFTDCNLKWATFQGAAPAVDSNAFTSQPSGFKLYYVNGSDGFTTPTWVGYPCFPGTPPQVTNEPPPATGQVGMQYYHDLTGSGTPAPVFRLTAGTLPDGVVIDQKWGGFPLNGYPITHGIFTATITASNGIPPDATQTFTIDTNEYRTLVTAGTNGTISGGSVHILNSTATLTATPSPGYLFTGWTGDATGTGNPLPVLMDANKTISATFSPDTTDTDDDGFTNYEEIVIHGTNPTLPDTDGDNVKDSKDAFALDPAETLDTDHDGTGDNADLDDDGDGLSDEDEINIHGTNPKLADSDGDGLSDPAEIQTHLTNPNVADTDNDGLSDGAEVNTHGTLPKAGDTDGDGFLDGYEVLTGKLPLDPLDKPALVAEARTAIEFVFPAAIGKTYRIEASTDLTVWGTVESGIVGAGGQVQRFYSILNVPKRYFRVEEE